MFDPPAPYENETEAEFIAREQAHFDRTSPSPAPDLAAIEGRWNAISAWPWYIFEQTIRDREHAKEELAKLVDGTEVFVPLLPMVRSYGGKCVAVTGCGPNGAANAEAIMHAPSDIRALLDRVRELEAGIKKWEDNVRIMLADDPDKVECREGGGPEDLIGTLVLSVARMQHKRSAMLGTVQWLEAENAELTKESSILMHRAAGLGMAVMDGRLDESDCPEVQEAFRNWQASDESTEDLDPLYLAIEKEIRASRKGGSQ